MSDYAPGTVALATVRGVENVRVFRYSASWASAGPVKSALSHLDRHVTDIRPLIVLDLADPEHVVDVLRERAVGPGWGELMKLADKIEAQTKPPKPAEPTGLGAVVEDAHGTRWTRVEPGGAVTRNPWYPADDLDLQPDEYGCIDAVRVLSEGVQS